jgi:hypothetical protein
MKSPSHDVIERAGFDLELPGAPVMRKLALNGKFPYITGLFKDFCHKKIRGSICYRARAKQQRLVLFICTSMLVEIIERK